MINNDLTWYRENNFPNEVVNWAEELASHIEQYYGLSFDGLFISNKKNEEQEDYPSLWLYNNDYVVESKDFLSQKQLDIDLARYHGNVKYFNIIADKFTSLNNPTDESKIKLKVSLGNNISCDICAVGVNCSNLSKLAQKFLEEHIEKL